MRRAALLFGAGLLLGALAMYVLRTDEVEVAAPVVTRQNDTSAGSPAAGERAFQSVEFLELVTGTVSMTERAAIYRFAAQADRATLESLVSQAAALPNTTGRVLALEVLLTRYAEIDAPAAAALADELDLKPAITTPLFAVWARRDPNGALRGLGNRDAPTALALGIELLRVLGNDDLGIARVLGAAPQLDADRFRIEAAVAKAAVDPVAALEDALLLPPTGSSAALMRIATLWARRDVHEALAHFESIPDEGLRNIFRAAVIDEWANRDPEATLAYIFDLDPEDQQQALVFGALEAFALLEPTRALAAAEGLKGQAGTMMRQAALMSLARDDPLAALRQAEALPPGGEREQMMTMVAAVYGQVDPEAALAWALSLKPPPPGIIANVLTGLARVDAHRAVELAFTAMPVNEQQRVLQTLVMSDALSTEQTAALADRLAATSNRGRALQSMLSTWAQHQPEDALRWLLANPERAPGVIGAAGASLARTDPATAMRYLEQVPSDLRATWLRSVAGGYAQNDSLAAANWVAQYRGQPGYDGAVAAVAARTAERDAIAAARLFDSIDIAQTPEAPSAAAAIAARWARQDPRAAASWAAGLGDDAVSSMAVGVVAQQWTAQDVPAARAWVLNLPTSPTRDAALVQLLGALSESGTVDQALLLGFSSSAAQQRGVSEAVRFIAQRDPAAARQLADQYLTDPTMRQAAERFIGR